MIQSLNELALALGYAALLGIVCVAALVFSLLWSAYDASDDAKAAGQRIGRETPLPASLGTVIASDIEEQMGEIGDDPTLSYEPQPVAHFDWSMNGDRLDREDVLRAGGGLKAAGLSLHPFPRSPDDPRVDGWEWSDQHVGVWLDEPTFYVEGDSGRRVVETDLSDWEPATAREGLTDRNAADD